MEIISFECPQCHQPMGVAKEQRGQQVQCPHCYQIVQTPALDAPTPLMPVNQHQAASGSSATTPADLFPPPGGMAMEAYGRVPSGPVEPMPTPPTPQAQPVAEPGPALEPHSSFVAEVQTGSHLVPLSDGAVYGEETAAPHDMLSSELPAEGVAPARVRRPEKRSLLVPILLIFLVPYSVTITAFFAWYLYQVKRANESRIDPLERLPDPKPGKGGAVRIHPTRSALPPKLKTALNQSLRVGDLEITPLRVEKDGQGRLSLYLRLRDVSPDVAFNPVLPAEDYQFRRISMEDTGPYTYLEAGDRRLYMRGAEYEQTPPRKQGALFDGMLQPGEEMVAVFRTQADDKGVVQTAAGTLVWRVQLRRGLVAVGDTEVSATAVVGVAFDTRAIASHG